MDFHWPVFPCPSIPLPSIQKHALISIAGSTHQANRECERTRASGDVQWLKAEAAAVAQLKQRPPASESFTELDIHTGPRAAADTAARRRPALAGRGKGVAQVE